jgi:hypothetical protein
MTLNAAPNNGENELSLETPQEEAARLGNEVRNKSAMEEVREAKESGDPSLIAAAEARADEIYAVDQKPTDGAVELHDAHVKEKEGEDFITAIEAAGEKSAAEYNNPEVVKARMERLYDAISKTSDSEVSALISNTTLKVDVLAGKDPTYLAGDMLIKLARDLSRNNPETFDATLATETAKYLDGVKGKFKQEGYNPRIIDILTSGKDNENKVKDLEQISFTV